MILFMLPLLLYLFASMAYTVAIPILSRTWGRVFEEGPKGSVFGHQ